MLSKITKYEIVSIKPYNLKGYKKNRLTFKVYNKKGQSKTLVAYLASHADFDKKPYGGK